MAVGRIPEQAEALATAARLGNLALPDAGRLLAGTLPRILVRASPEAEALAAALGAAGFVAWTGEPADVPTDEQRIVVRSLAWEPGGFRATDSLGVQHPCPAASVRLLQRGARSHQATDITQTKETKFNLGRAVLSGGLLLTKTTARVKETTTHTKEPFLLLQRGDGQPDLLISEHRVNYACLGAEMKHATLANFNLLCQRLQALCAAAPLDDRVARPGFVAGQPHLSVDALDLALHLVSEARRRSC
ncbi:hypothetical protein [Geothrix sp. PMB-07]|uniref:hypothetical protein n=1 Tax=Geothrix sp. PMB-07 TaxID=3068640 RepID=UPI002740F647|nr:hypothetical protein [Geothrix sp. PMB-07]WLT30981.1 hypothetical protein Q9293_14785 [Geothrix sp. PMB-07]